MIFLLFIEYKACAHFDNELSEIDHDSFNVGIFLKTLTEKINILIKYIQLLTGTCLYTFGNSNYQLKISFIRN